LIAVNSALALGYSHYIIFCLSVVAIFWGLFLWVKLNNMAKDDKIVASELRLPEGHDSPDQKIQAKEKLMQTASQIKEGAKAFLNKEYLLLTFFCVLFGAVLLCAVDQPWNKQSAAPGIPYTTICFLVGAGTSMLAGYIGMMVATTTNVVTTYKCCEPTTGLADGFNVAYQGGQVLGFCLVGLALLILESMILSSKDSIMNNIGKEATQAQIQRQVQVLFECISGYGLGGSTVALFGRVGGGIYTKAADVGADLAGKVIENLPEDSPLNPGTIADNVGDNVGDIAGMGADLFGSLAESTCAALVVSGTSWPLVSTPDAVYFPLLVTAIGIAASFVTVQIAHLGASWEVGFKLRMQLIISTVLMSVAIVPLLYIIPEQLNIHFASNSFVASRMEIYGCLMMGLWSGLAIGLSTEYYTSHSFAPTRGLAEACKSDAATNVILGLALGYKSNGIPIICLALTVLLSFHWAAMYGVALAALGMLGCLPVCLSVDGYGPISDNAGGIAEMVELDESIRKNTDELDAAGNTTAAIGKGFAIGSACLVALALFGAYITRVSEIDPSAFNVNILEPYTFAGLLFGAMLPYYFSALTMAAVGSAAMDMIAEIKDQISTMRGLINKKWQDENRTDEKPDFMLFKDQGVPNSGRCVAISTGASLRKMIEPGCIVILSPLVFGALFGHRFVSGMLAGTITSGIQIAFSASNTGGAWDNAKKFTEKGDLHRNEEQQRQFLDFLVKEMGALHGARRALAEKWAEAKKHNNATAMKECEHAVLVVKKKDPEHKAAVVGDTVGDPLKDTSGPAINILIKLSAITSLVFGSYIKANALFADA